MKSFDIFRSAFTSGGIFNSRGFLLHHSGVWCIHQFRSAAFFFAQPQKVLGDQRYLQTSQYCEFQDIYS